MHATPEQRRAFGAALRVEREEAGLTQQTLADRLGVTGSAVGQWEDEGSTLPDGPAEVFALEEVLGVPAGRLSRHLGFGPYGGAEVDAVAAIEEDPDLTPERRDELVALYHLYLSRSKRGK